MIEINQIPILSDNYTYLIIDKVTRTCASVDPSISEPVISIIEKENLNLNYILNTHHHWDHVGGNLELKKKYDCKIVGNLNDKDRIPGIDICLNDGESFKLGNSKCKVFEISGHTVGHIGYYFKDDNALFCGDTLFSLGCGRIFEGTHKQMLTSLNKIKKFPKDTKIYCGHEYTYKNAEFCLKYDNDNEDLKKKFEIIKKLRSKNLPTIPAVLKDELNSNIFLRCDQNDIKIKLNMKNQEDFKVFEKVRDLKDAF